MVNGAFGGNFVELLVRVSISLGRWWAILGVFGAGINTGVPGITVRIGVGIFGFLAAWWLDQLDNLMALMLDWFDDSAAL